MMVSFLLVNRFPLLLWWGPDYVSVYNDAYCPILGTKHPRSMGQPVGEVWSEIWHILKPLIDTPFLGGPATWMEDIELEINRHGFVEETHFTIAYSPVPDESAARGIGGVLATVHEITEKVVSERRVDVLRDLSVRAMEAKTAEEACDHVASALATHERDIPFALLYVIDEETGLARLAGVAGTEPGQAISPWTLPLDADLASGTWPLADAARGADIIAVEDLARRFGNVPPVPGETRRIAAWSFLSAPAKPMSWPALWWLASAPASASTISIAPSTSWWRARSPSPSPMPVPTRKNAGGPRSWRRSIAPRRCFSQMLVTSFAHR
jgi:hypothetical protein